ncbi:MAG TPA: DNA-processing protein DprA, partial [archaeon]|nr:DNA-processing protein DprA [archaeon]
PGLSAEVLAALSRKDWNDHQVDRQLEIMQKVGIRPLYIWQSEYPAYLGQIYDPPPLVFVRGRVEFLNLPCIAIVGTRGPSFYGRERARYLAAGLAGVGFTIISGLARGIDSTAHEAALDAGGATAAVLGSGADIVYPPENAGLAERILERGALISEYLMGTPPEARNFPRRNRLISGLSRGVLVVEADLKSGALITAAYSLEQNREVFAVPGDTNRNLSRGTNRLIQDGAKLVGSLKDILDEFGELVTGASHGGSQLEDEKPAFTLSQDERLVFESLSREPLHVDEIAEKLNMEISRLLSILLQLRMKQLVREHPGKLYSMG